jgi:hypothetical protein
LIPVSSGFALSPTEASHLDLHDPLERIPQPEITFLPQRYRIRDELPAGNGCSVPQLADNQLHRLVLWVWANASLTFAAAARDMSGAPSIDRLDRGRENSDELVLFAQPSFPDGTGIVQASCRCRIVRRAAASPRVPPRRLCRSLGDGALLLVVPGGSAELSSCRLLLRRLSRSPWKFGDDDPVVDGYTVTVAAASSATVGVTL